MATVNVLDLFDEYSHMTTGACNQRGLYISYAVILHTFVPVRLIKKMFAFRQSINASAKCIDHDCMFV